MAVPLRMSVPRMTVRSLGPIVLVTAERAYTATLRNWSRAEAHRLAVLVTWGKFHEAEAVRELAWHIAAQCQNSGIDGIVCDLLAASMLEDEVSSLDAEHEAVCREIVGAVQEHLDAEPDDFTGASSLATDIARRHKAPPALIGAGMRIAMRER